MSIEEGLLTWSGRFFHKYDNLIKGSMHKLRVAGKLIEFIISPKIVVIAVS